MYKSHPKESDSNGDQGTPEDHISVIEIVMVAGGEETVVVGVHEAIVVSFVN